MLGIVKWDHKWHDIIICDLEVKNIFVIKARLTQSSG